MSAAGRAAAKKTAAIRARLRAKVAEQDAARGRPLTDMARLDNLADVILAYRPEPKSQAAKNRRTKET